MIGLMAAKFHFEAARIFLQPRNSITSKIHQQLFKLKNYRLEPAFHICYDSEECIF